MTKYDFGKLIRMHRLFADTYLAEFEHCLAVIKVDEKGKIVKVSRFGNR